MVFRLCEMLAKKINMIIKEQNNDNLKKQREEQIIKQREQQKNMRKIKEANRKEKEDRKKIEQHKRKTESENIKNTIIITLFKYAKNIKNIMDRSFKRYKLDKILKNKKKTDSNIKNNNNNNNVITETIINKSTNFTFLNIETSDLSELNKNTFIDNNDININLNIETSDLSELISNKQINNTKEDIIDKKHYDKFLSIVQNEIYNNILYTKIYRILSYTFANKKLNMLNIKANAFDEKNLKIIAEEYEWENNINIIINNIIL